MNLSFFLRNKSEKQTVAKNFFWLSFGQISGRLIKAVLVIYAARILGATEYGRISLALGIIGLIFNFSHLGLNSLIVRELAKKVENEKKYLSTIFYLRNVLIFLAVAISIVVGFLMPSKNVSQIFFVLIIMATLESFISFFYSIARGKEKMEKEALVYLVEIISTTILGVLVLVKYPSAFNLAIAYVFGALMAFVIGTKIFFNYLKSALRGFEKSLIKPIVKDAWPLTATTLISSILGYTDITMLGLILKSSKDVGFYSAPLKIVNLLFVPTGIIASSIFPLLARKVKNNSEVSLVRKTFSVIFLIALPIVVGGFILSKPLIILIFSSKYLPSIKIFSVLIFMVLIIYPSTIFNNILFAHNRQKIAAVFSGSSALINIILNYFFIIKIGVLGAAIATVTSQFINFFLFLVYTKRIEKNWPITFWQIKNPLIASLAMALFLIFSPLKGLPVLINIGIGGLVYFLSLIALKEPFIFELKSLLKRAN